VILLINFVWRYKIINYNFLLNHSMWDYASGFINQLSVWSLKIEF